jgi:hypothetical protein
MAGYISNLIQTVTSTLKIRAQGGTGFSLVDSSGTATVQNFAASGQSPLRASVLQATGSNASNYVGLQAPGSLGSSVTFTLPNADGSNGSAITTNGSAVLGFTALPTNIGNAILVYSLSFTQATSSPATVFTPPANAYIWEAYLVMSVASGSSAATLSLGVSGAVTQYFATTDNDLTVTSTQFIPIVYSAGASPAAVIATITPASQTFTGKLFIKYGLSA